MVIINYHAVLLPLSDLYENLCLTLGGVVDRNSSIGDTWLSTMVFPWEVVVVLVDEVIWVDVVISITVDCLPSSDLLSRIVRARLVGFGEVVLSFRLE